MHRFRTAWAALVLFVVLAAFHTWPLIRAPARLSLNYNADAELNAWIVSWIAHALPSEPRHLFAGNIFQPDDHALAYSEPLVVPALAGAPIRWLGGSAVLTFNLLLLSGLAATALAGWWVVLRWTGSFTAGLVSGALVAFNTHLLTRLPHLQAAHAWGLVLVVYLTDHVLGRGGFSHRSRTTLLLAIVIAAVAMTSAYWLFFAALAVVVFLVARAESAKAVGHVTLACAIGALLAFPVLIPYLRLAAGGTRRPLEQVAQLSATPTGYLVSTSWMDFSWGHRFFTNGLNVLFPGIVALVLAGLGVHAAVKAGGDSRQRVLTLLGLAVVGIVLSLGPATPIYRVLYDILPPLQGLRAAVRFGYLFLLAVALIAGFGVAAIERRVRQPASVVFGTLLLGAVTIEAWHGPVRTIPFNGIPDIYSRLDDAKAPVLLVEVPFYPAEAVFENGDYVLNATGHWTPIMNGYSGYTPDAYRRRAALFWFFPEEWAIAAMRQEGATHVMVHLDRFGPEADRVRSALEKRTDLKLLAADRPGLLLYQFVEN
jgi:hypothetical protein